MPYSAFVAATKKDLEKQREYVTKQLRDAGLVVDPMENWPADAENPAVLSAKRTAGCHFCIALVGFQRGTIAGNDPKKRTITQIEIDTAIKNGLKILVFLLKENDASRQPWSLGLNEPEDRQFRAWRSDLESNMVCGYFDVGTMPEVLPAVTRQIVQWEERRRRRYLAIAALFISAFLVMLGVFVFSADFRDWAESRFLTFNDPIIFQNSRDGFYKIARLLDGRSDIQDNTKFRDEIRGSNVSFDLFANTFAAYRDYSKDFEELAKRGVHLRFVVTDFSDENRGNWDAFNNATEALVATRQETLFNARNIREMILDLEKRYSSQVELRLSRKPIFYTLWIRDPETPSAMAHLGINYYGQKSTWPAFRMSKRTGADQLESLREQFELIWKDAKPAVDE
jgi:Domain of unknown function (DUF4062)